MVVDAGQFVALDSSWNDLLSLWLQAVAGLEMRLECSCSLAWECSLCTAEFTTSSLPELWRGSDLEELVKLVNCRPSKELEEVVLSSL